MPQQTQSIDFQCLNTFEHIKIFRWLCWGATNDSRPIIAPQCCKGICSVLSKWSIFFFFTPSVNRTQESDIAKHLEGVREKPNTTIAVLSAVLFGIYSPLNEYCQ